MENILYHIFRDSDYIHAISEGSLEKSQLISVIEYLAIKKKMKIRNIYCIFEINEDNALEYYSNLTRRGILFGKKQGGTLFGNPMRKAEIIKLTKDYFNKYFKENGIECKYIDGENKNSVSIINSDIPKEIFNQASVEDNRVFVVHSYTGNIKSDFSTYVYDRVNFIYNNNDIYDLNLLENYNFNNDIFGYNVVKNNKLYKFYKDIENLSDFGNPDSKIITEDPEFLSEIKNAEYIAKSDFHVFLNGESGTGKELFAKYIHNCSKRNNLKFFPVNCAAFSNEIFNSEMFGYVPGAFTGGLKAGKTGIFESIKGGTLFLDEIGDLSPYNQTKLLRVLETHKIKKVGDDKEIDVDFRLICATNKDLMEQIEKGNFREDLYYRINKFDIHLKPLRDRGKKDIDLLIDFFQKDIEEKIQQKFSFGFSKEAKELIYKKSWPGNVRQLSSFLTRIFLRTSYSNLNQFNLNDLFQLNPSKQTSTGDLQENTVQNIIEGFNKINTDLKNLKTFSIQAKKNIDKETVKKYLDSEPDIIDYKWGKNEESNKDINLTEEEVIAQICKIINDKDYFNLKDFSNEIEEKIIKETLSKANQNKSKAAGILGLKQGTLSAKLKKLGITK